MQLVNHVPYGEATAHKLDDAKEMAAKEALIKYRGC